MGQIKEHVFEKSVRRPHHQGPGCRWSASLVVGQLFTMAMRGPTIIRPRAQLHVSLQNLFYCGADAMGQEVVKTHCCLETINIRLSYIAELAE